MNRKVLLVEPNYKNKYPPMGLMKLATYYRMVGDDVRFYKGDMRHLAVDLICEDLINHLSIVFPNVFWKNYYPTLFDFIKIGKYSILENDLLFNNEDVLDVLKEYRKKYKDKDLIKVLTGIRRCGKSTILDAIFAFDYQNDNLNKKYKQLNDTKNLYARPSEQKDSKISAFIVFDDADFDFLTGLFTTMHLFNTSSELLEGLSDDEINEKRINIIKNFLYSGVLLTRTIKSETVSSYEIEVNEDIESNKHFNIENLKTKSDEFAKKLIEYLPTMVYVMEFDTFLEEITLKPTPEQIQAEKEYRELYNNLFLAATNNYMGLDEFAKMTDARDYGPILEDVIKFLNEEFTKRWEKFSI